MKNISNAVIITLIIVLGIFLIAFVSTNQDNSLINKCIDGGGEPTVSSGKLERCEQSE